MESEKPKKILGKAPKTLVTGYVKRRYTLQDTIKQERSYLIFLGLVVMGAGIVYPYPHLAMWYGFFLAGYSTIANDSIQTIGTFIQSNHMRRWWVLWLFIGGVFLTTVTAGWFLYDGDVSWGRLSARGFETAPTSFSFLQVAAPIFLLILTRLRMPVSTTILILSSFATVPEGISSMLTKSLSGYFLAFAAAIIVWAGITRIEDRYVHSQPRAYWYPLQWISTAFLWSTWLMQDASNIAVFLPRQLSLEQFLVFALYIFFGLGLLLYLKGDRIQRVVSEKSNVVDVRSATIIDFVYALILFYFKTLNPVPMSTTWVFIGLLAGRELAISFFGTSPEKRSLKEAWILMRRDVMYAGIGLAVSIMIAAGVNPSIVTDLFRPG